MSDFEQWLRRYRPVGPPPELRHFELREYPIRAPILDWLPAAAAVVLIVLLHVLAAGIRDRVYEQFAPADSSIQNEAPLQ